MICISISLFFTSPQPLPQELILIHINAVPFILLMINSPPSPLYFVKRGVHMIWILIYSRTFPSWNTRYSITEKKRTKDLLK
jgi:hypothetical protein